MGCDIHMVLEQKSGDEWVGIHNYRIIEQQAVRMGFDEQPIPSGWITWRITDRNYRFFAELAGVRGEGSLGNQPRGLPEDMSQLTRALAEEWGIDGHSHSHLSLIEFIQAYCAAAEETDKLVANKLQPTSESQEWFRNMVGLVTGITIYDEDYDNFRICFWFDN